MTQTAATPDAQGNSLVVAKDHRLTVRRDLHAFEAAIAHYPDATKEAACWLYQYMMAKCNASPAVVAAQLKKLDPSSYPDKEQYIYQVTTGRYFRQAAGEKAVNALIEIVEVLRRQELFAAQTGKVAFNERLSCWTKISNYIDRKRQRDSICKFGAIEGSTGTGKTHCTDHYAIKNNHLSTVRFEAPAVPSLSRFMMKLGACYNVRPHVRTHERIVRIEENVNETRTIIVENVQRLYNPKTGPFQPIFSYIQELQDDTQSTWIFTWTPVFRNEILNGKDSKFFEQFISRIGGVEDILSLDRKLPKSDVVAIAEQFEVSDLDACYPLLSTWSKQAGPLRILYSRLQKAKRLARGKAVKLEHIEAVADVPVDQEEDDES